MEVFSVHAMLAPNWSVQYVRSLNSDVKIHRIEERSTLEIKILNSEIFTCCFALKMTQEKLLPDFSKILYAGVKYFTTCSLKF